MGQIELLLAQKAQEDVTENLLKVRSQAGLILNKVESDQNTFYDEFLQTKKSQGDEIYNELRDQLSL